MKWLLLLVTYGAGLLVGISLTSHGFPWYWWVAVVAMVWMGWESNNLSWRRRS